MQGEMHIFSNKSFTCIRNMFLCYSVLRYCNMRISNKLSALISLIHSVTKMGGLALQ